MKTNAYGREFIKYTSLNILGMLGLSCYILADTFFVSEGVGLNGLAALNLAIPVYSFTHGTGLMLGMGGATRYSILKSQGKEEGADRTFTNTVELTLAFGVFFALTGIFCSEAVTAMMGADAQVFEMTKTYLHILLLFAPIFLFNDVMICFVRNDGNPALAMTGMLVGSFANIFLDYFFIFPLKMGIFGAVLATGFAPAISLLILSRHLIKRRNGFHLVKMRPKLSLTKQAVPLGIPSLIAELSSGIVMIVFNAILLRLQGNVGVAAYGVVANLSLVVVAIFNGMAQGIQPLVSRAYGARDMGNSRRVLRYALFTMLGIAAAVYLSVFSLAGPITSVFNSENNQQLQGIAETGLKLYFTAVPFVGFNILLSVFFTSTEKAAPAHIISLLRGLFVIIPMAFFLSAEWGVNGVWLAFPVTEMIVSAAGMGMYVGWLKRRKR